MEHEAKRRLMERLDECLKEHGAALGANGLPSIGEVYEVQGLAEMHYYLKVEHVFNPAEVEALLRFKDPLDVARWCKEDNTHPHSLPICELLDEINAYQRFPQVEGSGPPLSAQFERLKKTLDQNLLDYRTSLLACEKDDLIQRADEIAAAAAAHEYMTQEYQPKADEVAFLLRYDDPLQVVRDYWPERTHELMPLDCVMETLMDDLYHAPQEERGPAPEKPAAEKPSVRERLQDAAREAAQHPAPEGKPRDAGAR